MITKLLLNTKQYNLNKKFKIFIPYPDMLSNKKFDPIVTELFIRGKKINIYLVFITQPYCAVPKNIRLNSSYYFIMKIPNKQEFQQIAFNHSSYIVFKDVTNLYKKCTAKPYSFLVIDATLESDNSFRFRKDLLERIFLRDIHEGYLTLKDADDEQSNFVAKLKNLDKKVKIIEKNNLGLFSSEREKVLNNFKSRLFPIKSLDKIPTHEPTLELATEATKQKKSKLKLQQEFVHKIIADGKDINHEIFWNYFQYQNPPSLAKDLIRAKEAKNEQ